MAACGPGVPPSHLAALIGPAAACCGGQSGARLRQLRASGEPVHAVAFSRDGAFVAAGSDDGAMKAWRTDDGSLRSQLNPRHGKVVDIEFDPSAALFVAANADGTATVADAAQGLPLAIVDGPSNALRTASSGRPPHRSEHALLTHSALASGSSFEDQTVIFAVSGVSIWQ